MLADRGRQAVTCIDARTGVVTWEVPVFGAKIHTWPRTGGEALLADGTPLALSRITKTELPDAELALPTQLDADGALMQTTAIGRDQWRFSDIMGAVASKNGVLVIRLGVGDDGATTDCDLQEGHLNPKQVIAHSRGLVACSSA
jgi:hypothetical protein